jgi:hypothetical protein
MDKVTAKKSDIYGNSTWILQKNSGFDGQFSLIGTFRAGFVRRFAVENILWEANAVYFAIQRGRQVDAQAVAGVEAVHG